jgi:hypothetical protein
MPIPEDATTAIAYFVSAHGFGHAARATAVMAAVHRRLPRTHFHIFTMAPDWFFADSLDGPHTCHPLETDVGLVQRTPLVEDIQETVGRLDALFPIGSERLEECRRQVTALRCRLVICDIAVLGIAVAKELGLPSILVENFTWDWIYDHYPDAPLELRRHARYQGQLYRQADHRIQTEPVCRPLPADLTVPPVSRSATAGRTDTRRRLQIAPDMPVVLVTMGGTPVTYSFLSRLRQEGEICFLLPGIASASEGIRKKDNLVMLPARSDFRHPDLIKATDAVVGKVGYSTLAEVYHAGVPFGYVQRPDFPESPPLADFIRSRMTALEIAPRDFEAGRWIPTLRRLLTHPRRRPGCPNGAHRIAEFIHERLQLG